MNSRQPFNSIRMAFTLIELLVVLSIIAILISILLPALSAAREISRGIACMSNARQVNLAITMYQEDHDGSYVPAFILTPRHYWPGLLTRGRYLSSFQVFDCPTLYSDYEDVLNSPTTGWANDSGNWRITELGYNVEYIGTSNKITPGDYSPANINEIKNPTKTWVLADSVRLDVIAGWNIIYDFNATSGIPDPRHQGGVNVAWADGHASRVGVSDPRDPQSVYAPDALTSYHDDPNYWDRK